MLKKIQNKLSYIACGAAAGNGYVPGAGGETSTSGSVANSGGTGLFGYSFMTIVGPIMMVVFLAVLIFGLVALIRYLGNQGGGGGGVKNNDEVLLSILKERYASGEISEKEFLHKKKELGV